MTTAWSHASSSGSGLYDAITSLGVHSPGFVQGLLLAYTKYGLLLVVPLVALLWWRARASGSAERMALALLVPAGTLAAYLFSEVLKTMVHEERPCRGLPVDSYIGECPAPGDWSFPSNHSVIAASAALGAVYAWRRAMPWLLSLAALMAFSRVFVGAHFPHDVLGGLFFGAAFAWLAHRFALDRATGLVERFAGRVPWRLLGTPPEPAEPYSADDDRTELIDRVPAGRPSGDGRGNPVAGRRNPTADRRTRPLPEPRLSQPDQHLRQPDPQRRSQPQPPRQPQSQPRPQAQPPRRALAQQQPVDRPVRPRPDQPPLPRQRPQQQPPRPR